MKIITLLTGKIEQLGQEGVSSGIKKMATLEREKVLETGLVNDNQADKKHHGGPDKAIHHYAFEHYEYWKNEPGVLNPEVFCEGGFGENISTVGMDESSVCIGDKYRVGSVVLEVSQARQPCWKLNIRFGHPGMSRMVQDSFRTGWYYRVLHEGEIQANDHFELLERPLAQWPLRKLLDVLYRDVLNYALLEEMTTLVPLAESWKRTAQNRLQTGAVEDWNKRLYNR
ncbi:MOSC domain-containing protein [Gaoshiqia sediminis]|uniref:MOSC domain-containing protein n=1 Tax=Gaoshiqia sediminis TaxID=2986998 RepID=A0AA42C502_9BACT|nr:MOSC domain-containing protein [Gaoshiqia sediminis]MCW0482313.1 MOSC domain-containing protein [Gaoshiqia sediminis]